MLINCILHNKNMHLEFIQSCLTITNETSLLARHIYFILYKNKQKKQQGQKSGNTNICPYSFFHTFPVLVNTYIKCHTFPRNPVNHHFSKHNAFIMSLFLWCLRHGGVLVSFISNITQCFIILKLYFKVILFFNIYNFFLQFQLFQYFK